MRKMVLNLVRLPNICYSVKLTSSNLQTHFSKHSNLSRILQNNFIKPCSPGVVNWFQTKYAYLYNKARECYAENSMTLNNICSTSWKHYIRATHSFKLEYGT